MSMMSALLLGLGLVFWLWGSAPLLGKESVLVKLHGLSVADTLGSALIVLGLLLRGSREWPLLLLALLTLVVWNTLLGHVLAAVAQPPPVRRERP